MIGFITTLIGSRAISLVLVLGVTALGGWIYLANHYKGEGAEKERARLQLEEKKRNARAKAKRRAARANPGRVLETYYRD